MLTVSFALVSVNKNWERSLARSQKKKMVTINNPVINEDVNIVSNLFGCLFRDSLTLPWLGKGKHVALGTTSAVSVMTD